MKMDTITRKRRDHHRDLRRSELGDRRGQDLILTHVMCDITTARGHKTDRHQRAVVGRIRFANRDMRNTSVEQPTFKPCELRFMACAQHDHRGHIDWLGGMELNHRPLG